MLVLMYFIEEMGKTDFQFSQYLALVYLFYSGFINSSSSHWSKPGCIKLWCSVSLCRWDVDVSTLLDLQLFMVTLSSYLD